jgi:hypothetical protein
MVGDGEHPIIWDKGNQMKEKDDDIAHPHMVSKPEKTPNLVQFSIHHGHVAFSENQT